MEFTLFPNLPADVRQEIWRIAALEPPSSPAICHLSILLRVNDDGLDLDASPPRLVIQPAPNRALLATNTEAHDIALMSPRPPRDFNPATDVLYIDSPRTWDTFLAKRRDLRWHETVVHCLRNVRHIALSMQCAALELWVPEQERPIPLGELDLLTKISIVYPKPSEFGSSTWWNDVTTPQGDATLRLLTDAERAKSRLSGLMVPSGLPMGVDEHLGALEISLIKLCQSHGERRHGGVSFSSTWHSYTCICRKRTMWDRKAGKLNLKFEATCFNPVDFKRTFHKILRFEPVRFEPIEFKVQQPQR
ncbi:hypothetical protein QBC44DRAFT_404522 [Cladorrhinum sp. PSN332]|nr:hypothetical protein QBC44DRAFT_404522 [Cladorrhinum sp. PSN332]